MNKYKLIAICGKSASGKDTLLQGMLNSMGENAHKIINHTTRPPREGEVNDENYHFITNDEFIHKIWHKEMLETAMYRDWWYGTAIDELQENKVNIGVFNHTALQSLIQHKDKIDIFVVFVTASDKTRLLRSLYREEDPDVAEIVRRYQADQVEWKDFHEFNFMVVNDGNKEITSARMTAMTALIIDAAAELWAKEVN